jgi:hypothetical protein
MTRAVDMSSHAISPAPKVGVATDTFSLAPKVNVYSFMNEEIFKLFIFSGQKLNTGQLSKNIRYSGNKMQLCKSVWNEIGKMFKKGKERGFPLSVYFIY